MTSKSNNAALTMLNEDQIRQILTDAKRAVSNLDKNDPNVQKEIVSYLAKPAGIEDPLLAENARKLYLTAIEMLEENSDGQNLTPIFDSNGRDIIGYTVLPHELDRTAKNLAQSIEEHDEKSITTILREAEDYLLRTTFNVRDREEMANKFLLAVHIYEKDHGEKEPDNLISQFMDFLNRVGSSDNKDNS